MNQNPPTDEQLDQIEARANAASKGPWTVALEQCDCSDGLCGHGTYVSSVYSGGVLRTEFGDFPDADWQFVIHAREDVDTLLAEVRRLRAELDAEKSAHRFTLRQRNNRSERLLYLRDLANAAATGGPAEATALIEAARDTLAASRTDHDACAAPAVSGGEQQ